VFFDECVPRPLRKLLAGHEIKTAQDMGWSRMKNGELIRRAEAEGFYVFVTSDRNLRYQQNLQGRKIALLALSTNHWPALAKEYALVQSVLTSIQPGQYVDLEIPEV
jgi:hypothetical protein